MSQSATTEDEFRAKASIPEGAVPLESILCTEELDLRPSRPPDYEKENCALVKLMSALADSPNTVFQTLTETILDITRSHSAGVSLLTRDGKALDVCGNRFFWPAVAGMWKAYIGGGTPRDFGPCGDVLDRNCSLPFRHLERRYTYFPPPINECLLVPFYVAGKAVGTIWALAHDDQRKFDAEDNRVMVSLGKFASSAYQALTHIEDLKFEVAEREKAEAEVRELARGLEARVAERTSELQHSAQELQRNEFYLAEGQRLGHTGSWAFNSSGFFEYWSPELFQIYGLDPQKGAPTLEQYLATIHPQDREFMAEAVKRMCEQSSGCDVKKRIIRADGEIRYVRCVGVPVLDSQVLKGFLGTAMDVTEHELLTQELRRRAAYLAEAQKLSHTGSFGWSPDSGEIVWSDETYRIFERDRAVQPTIGSVAQRVHPEDRADFQRVIDAASAEATHFEHTYRLLLPDGRVKHVHALANALEDASGNREFVGAVTDITERNRAEEALRVAMSERTRLSAVRAEVATALASKDDLPRILNKCADAVVQHLDAAFTRIWTLKHGGGELELQASSGIYTRLNGRYSRIPIGQMKIGLIANERQAHLTNDVQNDARISDHNWAKTENIRSFAGYPLVVEDRVVGVIGMFSRHALAENTLESLAFIADGIAQGIERKRAEDALRSSEQNLQLTLDTIDGLVTTVSPSGELEFANRRLLEYTGNTIEELKTNTGILHPDDSERVKGQWTHALRTGEALYSETRIRRHDGVFRWFVMTALPLTDQDNRILRWCNLITDVHDRKEAEEKLRQTQEDLRKTQAEFAHVNRVMTMGELTASIAHEVNQPLAAIVSSGDSCTAWLANEPPNLDKARASASRMVQAATQASEIVQRIRGLFRKRASMAEAVYVNEVIEETISFVEGEAQRKGVSLRTELAVGLPSLNGDRIQLQQVILNLMMNGLDAMSGLDSEPKTLLIQSALTNQRELLVSVADTGPGINAEHASRLFTPFFTTKPHGVGMGLRISRSIIEAHGGRLWAEKNEPRGAAFRFTLPIKEER